MKCTLTVCVVLNLYVNLTLTCSTVQYHTLVVYSINIYHLRQLRKFRVSPAILKTFYSGAIESVLTQCISVWYGNSSNRECKALQKIVRLAERISGSALPSLQDIYLKLCKSFAENCALSRAHLRVCSPLSAGHLPQTLQKQSC